MMKMNIITITLGSVNSCMKMPVIGSGWPESRVA
jgi:hypothetical protein